METRSKNIEVTMRYLDLLKDLYELTNNVGFVKVSIRELIRKYRLPNSLRKHYKLFLIADEEHGYFVKWAKPENYPTIKDAEMIHRKNIEDYRNYMRKKREKENKIKKHFLKEPNLWPTEHVTRRCSLKMFSIEALISEIRIRGFSGNITKSIDI